MYYAVTMLLQLILYCTCSIAKTLSILERTTKNSPKATLLEMPKLLLTRKGGRGTLITVTNYKALSTSKCL